MSNQPTVHENAFHDVKDRKELLGQLAGAASVCWDDPGGAGVFHSEEASKFVKDALIRLDELEMDSHDDETIAKVHRAIMLTDLVTEQQAVSMMLNMQNAGILFRERK